MNLYTLEHPLITHKLTEMRDVSTNSRMFRQNLTEISTFLAYEILRDLPLKDKLIKTPLCDSVQQVLDKNVVVVPVLRAGLGMVDGFINAHPDIHIGHVGMERDESTFKPKPYYYKVPKIDNSVTVVVDPMLATGGSADETITELKENGITNIKLACILGVKEGVERINKNHSDVDIWLCALDEELNEKAYILPGLGDAGDRIYRY